MSNSTIINKFGTMKGWSSIIANMLGRDVEGISTLSYSDNVTKENVYGAGKFPIGRSQGNYEPECAVSLYKEESDALKASLPTGKRLQDIAAFDIIVQYQNDGGQIVKDIIHNVEFTNDGVDVAQGDGTIVTEYTLICSHITWNAA